MKMLVASRRLLFWTALTFGVSVAHAQITFSIDNFTTDELRLTFDTSNLAGPTPTNEGNWFLYAGDRPNHEWITATTTSVNETYPGGGPTYLGMKPQNVSFAPTSIPNFNDYIIIAWPVALGPAGNTINGGTIVLPSIGGFDPTAITNQTLDLFWGSDNSFDPLNGAYQSSATFVPEPSAYATLAGFAALALAWLRRRRRVARGL